MKSHILDIAGPFSLLGVLQEHSDRLMEPFENSQIDLLQNADFLLQTVVTVLNLPKPNFKQLLSSFRDLVRITQPERSKQSFSQYKHILSLWMITNDLQPSQVLKVQKLYLKQVQKAIFQYKYLNTQKKSSSIKNTLKTLIKKLSILKNNQERFSFNQNVTRKHEKGLQIIFQYYAKQHFMIGRTPSFSTIHKASGIIDLGAFIFFCRSFSLYPPTADYQKRAFTRVQIQEAFKKHAYLRRDLSFSRFKKVVDQLACLYFNQDFDRIQPVAYSHIKLEQKRLLFYEVLQLDNYEYLRSRFQPIRTSFNSSTNKKWKSLGICYKRPQSAFKKLGQIKLINGV